ncbi:Homeobox protein PKNOX2 [Halotydeus destructor]|nr:Homeobox protein PKNOX2 [Halotydeus destructor]
MDSEDSASNCSSSSLSQDETQILINSIKKIAPSAEIEISDFTNRHLHQIDDSFPSIHDEPIIADDDRTTIDNQEQHEKDKKAVYAHPLFPVLEYLLKKCELATSTVSGCNSISKDSLSSDVNDILEAQLKTADSFFTQDKELDALMIKAIQVMRIHLLELEKVHELCQDFCQRYISCLKTKMSSENLLRGTSHLGRPSNSLDISSCDSSDENSTVGLPLKIAERDKAPISEEFEESIDACSSHAKPSSPASAIRIDSGNEGDLSDDASALVSGRNPPPSRHCGKERVSASSHLYYMNRRQQQKRGILPKQATSIMRSWLFQHIVHPYPTEDEKRAIATETSLTLLQVNNWFINARRRILQPMLDSSSRSGQSEQAANSNGKAAPARNGQASPVDATSSSHKLPVISQHI